VSSCPGTLTVQVEDCQVEMCVCSRIGCFVWWKKHCGVRQVSTHYSTRLSCLTLGESLYFFKSQVYNCKKGIITLHRVVAHIKWGSPKKSLVHNLYFFPPPSSSPRIFWITSV
jgi:hypothetical protein